MTNEAKAREAHRDEAFRMYDRGGRGSNMAFGEYYDDSDHPFLDDHTALMRDLDTLKAVATEQAVRLGEQAAEIERLRTAVAFFACTVKSGEPWTDRCEQMKGTVFSTPEEQAAGE